MPMEEPQLFYLFIRDTNLREEPVGVSTGPDRQLYDLLAGQYPNNTISVVAVRNGEFLAKRFSLVDPEDLKTGNHESYTLMEIDPDEVLDHGDELYVLFSNTPRDFLAEAKNLKCEDPEYVAGAMINPEDGCHLHSNPYFKSLNGSSIEYLWLSDNCCSVSVSKNDGSLMLEVGRVESFYTPIKVYAMNPFHPAESKA